MLQKVPLPDQVSYDEQASFLTPEYLWDVVKRRFWFFVIPFVLIAVVGTAIVSFLPAIYLSEGKILVESQRIPTELVRPTVAALVNERIQIIEQRIMTRDKVLGIANKLHLFSGRQAHLSGTDMLDFVRSRTQIKPLELRLPQRDRNQAIAFTVGFEHENPQIAMRVANEFLTMILDEDVRTRTNFASETTKFLERESKRLEAELSTIETQIAEIKSRPTRAPSEAADKQLLTLRAELLQKSAVFSDAHPEMKNLKQKIAAMEKAIAPSVDNTAGLDALERVQASVQKGLENANQKLTLARLGESLERGQQSERLEVIEQPSLPNKPVRPNVLKLLASVLAVAVGAGGALVFVLEMLDKTVYRSSDVLRLVDSHLVVTVPYITTPREIVRQRAKVFILAGLVVAAIAAVIVIVAVFLPQLSGKIQVIMERALSGVRI